MGRTVLLLHETPDGGRHYDWLIEREPGSGMGNPGPEAPDGLVAFRVWVRIDQGPREFEAQRIADHRQEYLTYEGPVSDGRGTVRRVAAGEMVIEREGEGTFQAQGWIGGAAGVFVGVVGRDQDRWRFELARR